MSAHEIVQMLGLPEDDVCRSLLGLLSTGLVEYKAALRGASAPKPKPAAPAPPPPPAAPPPAPPPPPPPQAAKPAAPPPAPPKPSPPPAPPAPPPPPPPRVETAEDRRKEILDAWNGIKTRTHYEVLGLGMEAGPPQVKEAYFKLAKRFHPDVHTDPALADLRDKLDAIFIRLGQAYEALKDVKPRVVPKPAPTAPAAPEAPPEPPPPAAPAMMDPRAAQEAIVKADRYFIQDKFWDAIQTLEPILGNAPPKQLNKARLVLAKCYLKNPNWVRRAEEQLQLLLKDDPKNAEGTYQLAKIYANGGLKGRAITLLKKVLELKPEHEEAFNDLTQLAPPPEEEPQNQGFLKKLFGKN